MKIVHKLVPTSTIEDFADQHNLTMVVTERSSEQATKNTKYFAHFEDCEVMRNNILVGSYGDGATPEDAIAAYAIEISEQQIAIGARTPARRNIQVPRLTVAQKDPKNT